MIEGFLAPQISVLDYFIFIIFRLHQIDSRTAKQTRVLLMHGRVLIHLGLYRLVMEQLWAKIKKISRALAPSWLSLTCQPKETSNVWEKCDLQKLWELPRASCMWYWCSFTLKEHQSIIRWSTQAGGILWWKTNHLHCGHFIHCSKFSDYRNPMRGMDSFHACHPSSSLLLKLHLQMLEGCSYKSIVFKPKTFFCKVYRCAQTVSWLTRMSHDNTIQNIQKKNTNNVCTVSAVVI